jgi:hypothetical protein
MGAFVLQMGDLDSREYPRIAGVCSVFVRLMLNHEYSRILLFLKDIWIVVLWKWSQDLT